MRFITAIYGSKHTGMLLAHLESIRRSHPDARTSVYWQDVPDRLIQAVQSSFSQVDFTQTRFDFAGDPVNRIASKVLCWARAAEEHASESLLVFADADTLVCRDLSPFFAATSAGIIFTEKPHESAPINTGVMLARGGEAMTQFFAAWRERTLAVLRTPALLEQATNPELPYAAPDQMSFYQLVGYERGRTDYPVRLDDASLVQVHAAPCSQLNETNSRPLDDEIHVIHYKAGWQRILLDGRPFSRFRPRRASWPMFALFLEIFADALTRVNSTANPRFRPADFGITWPWYYARPGRFRPAGYLAWRVREAYKRGWLVITGQLKPGQ